MHDVRIYQEVTDRLVQRRGRVHVYDHIEARTAALVVIDMQNHWVMEGHPAYAPAAAAIVPNINRLAGLLRKKGGSVVWIKMSASQEVLKYWERFREFVGTEDVAEKWSDSLTEGAVGFELWSGLDVQENDTVIVKNRFSALTSGASNLETWLRNAGIETVIIAGTATNTCCEATARDANALNFKTVVVSDATAARSNAEHNAALSSLLNFFADILTTEEVEGRLR